MKVFRKIIGTFREKKKHFNFFFTLRQANGSFWFFLSLIVLCSTFGSCLTFLTELKFFLIQWRHFFFSLDYFFRHFFLESRSTFFDNYYWTSFFFWNLIPILRNRSFNADIILFSVVSILFENVSDAFLLLTFLLRSGGGNTFTDKTYLCIFPYKMSFPFKAHSLHQTLKGGINVFKGSTTISG